MDKRAHHTKRPKCLLTLFGAEHGLGGVSGYDVAETTDESPERVAALQRLTFAARSTPKTQLGPQRVLPWRGSVHWAGSNTNDALTGAGRGSVNLGPSL